MLKYSANAHLQEIIPYLLNSLHILDQIAQNFPVIVSTSYI